MFFFCGSGVGGSGSWYLKAWFPSHRKPSFSGASYCGTNNLESNLELEIYSSFWWQSRGGVGRVELHCWTDFNHCNLEDGIVPVLSRSWDLKSQGSLGDFCDISRSAGATVPGNSFLLSKWTSSQSMVAALSQGTFTCLETLRLEDASTWPVLSSLQITIKDR